MHWPFSFNRRAKLAADRERDIMRDIKVIESQQALLTAATETADAANVVTHSLRSRLEDSMQQIESTARILNDALIICDLNGKVKAFNPSAERMFNIKAADVRESFVGDLFESESHQLDAPENIWGFLDEIDSSADDHDLVGVTPDGATFPVDVNHTRLDRSDNSSIVLMVLRDLTPCIEKERALKSYRSMFNSAFDCILVVIEGKIVAANPVASDFFGYTVDELLDKSLTDLVIGGDPLIAAVVDGEDAFCVDGEIKDNSGSEMEVHFTTSLISWDGSPASLVTIKDMTRLSDSKAEAENMICCFDDHFHITFSNARFANFYGFKREKLIGVDVRTLMAPGELNPFLMHINSLTPQTSSRRMQIQTRNAAGEARLQIWTDHASFDEDGVEYQRIGRDISPPSIKDQN